MRGLQLALVLSVILIESERNMYCCILPHVKNAQIELGFGKYWVIPRSALKMEKTAPGMKKGRRRFPGPFARIVTSHRIGGVPNNHTFAKRKCGAAQR